MKEHLLPADTRRRLASLVGQRMVAAYGDPVELVASLDGCDVVCTPSYHVAASRNGPDEIVRVEVSFESMGPRTGDQILPRDFDGRLTGILVAETVVVFTGHEEYGPAGRGVARLPRALWGLLRSLVRPSPEGQGVAVVADVAEGGPMRGLRGHEEVSCHPEAWPLLRDVDEAYVNRVDAGVVFELDGSHYLPAFSLSNSSFLPIDGRAKDLRSWQELTERFPSYRFTRIAATGRRWAPASPPYPR